jgi:hypothetical protein
MGVNLRTCSVAASSGMVVTRKTCCAWAKAPKASRAQPSRAFSVREGDRLIMVGSLGGWTGGLEGGIPASRRTLLHCPLLESITEQRAVPDSSNCSPGRCRRAGRRGRRRPAGACRLVSPKFFYDALGSRLFDAITELPEYYPTRTEAAIFAQPWRGHRRGGTLAPSARPVLVDLGAGNGAKAARLFGPLRRPLRGGGHLGGLPAQSLQRPAAPPPGADLVGVGLDFSHRLQCPPGCAMARRWCSTRAPASATSTPMRRCACCARRVRWPPAARC